MAELQRRLEFHERLIELLKTRGSVINTEDGWLWDPFDFENNDIDTDPEPDVVVHSKVNVYFQPPESLKIKYPCIVYELNNIKTIHANNKPYANFRSYTVTFITWFPDTEIVERLASLPMTSFNGSPFKSDNLYHYRFTIYY